MNAKHSLKLAGLIFFIPCIALSIDQPLMSTECTNIADDSQRLVCFDRLAASRVREKSLKPNMGTTGVASAPPLQHPWQYTTRRSKRTVLRGIGNWSLNINMELLPSVLTMATIYF